MKRDLTCQKLVKQPSCWYSDQTPEFTLQALPLYTAMDKEDKYKKLKKRLKEVIEENDMLTTRLKRVKLDNTLLKKEKEILLDRIAQVERPSVLSATSEGYLSDATSATSLSTLSSSSASRLLAPTRPDLAASESQRQSSSHSKSDSVSQPILIAASKNEHPPEATDPIHSTSTQAGLTPDTPQNHPPGNDATPRKTPEIFEVQCATPLELNASTGGEDSKKRRKRNDISTRVRKIQDVAVNEDGSPILPAQFGMVTLHDLGEIVWDRAGFHTERYIFPSGFTTSREYFSMFDPEKSVRYVCQVIDTEDGPKFQVVPDDAPENIIIGGSATGAWTTVIKAANTLRSREHSNSASGPDFFGFSQPTIQKLIQDLPNANLCKLYTFQKFEVSASKRALPKFKSESGPAAAKHSNATSTTSMTPESRSAWVSSTTPPIPLGALDAAQSKGILLDSLDIPMEEVHSTFSPMSTDSLFHQSNLSSKQQLNVNAGLSARSRTHILGHDL
ncbi:hypothetical protein BASA81_004632 [Batrachochytrium salamandrivorans]|nr:hypothetical protein BASA81_004632 [Batrachochytrium salamandrivorans]